MEKLKSDYFRIEMYKKEKLKKVENKLKSDYFRIEMYNFFTSTERASLAKIRLF